MAIKPFVVERSTVIPVPPERIYPLVADFHEWVRWSPWEGTDPEMERTYGGPSSGEGASYHWRGNRRAGEGSMEITEADPPETLNLRLAFTRPFKAENRLVFLFEEVESGTKVTWRMSGSQGGVGRAFSKLVNMDARLGKDFEDGLSSLDREARRGA